MIKTWKVEPSPSKGFPDRRILLLDADDRKQVQQLKESFTGKIGVVFKSRNDKYRWSAYIYGASDNIIKLIEDEIKVMASSRGALPAAGKPAEKSEILKKKEEKTQAKTEDKKTGAPEIEQTVPKVPAGKPEADANKREEKTAEKPAAPVVREEKKKEPAPAKTEEKKPEKPAAPSVKPEGKPEAEQKKEAAPEPEFPKPAVKAEKKEKPPPPALEKFSDSAKPHKETAQVAPPAGVEKFERLTPDSSPEKPLSQPIIETFEKKVITGGKKIETEKTAGKKEAAAAPAEKSPEPAPEEEAADGKKKIRISYFCPAEKKELVEQVKDNITNIIKEKNINFSFRPVSDFYYEKAETKETVIARIKAGSFDFLIAVAPDIQGEVILKELKRKGYKPKVIAEDNIDKKFRYLNLITDIVLSPRK